MNAECLLVETFSDEGKITNSCLAKRLGQFCENFENTRENLSLILRGLMQLQVEIREL